MLTRNGFAQLIAYIQWIKDSGDGHQILPDYQITHIDGLIANGMPVPDQRPIGVDIGELDSLLMYMRNGTQKIEAIKAYRKLTGAGLVEAKNTIDRYWTMQSDRLSMKNVNRMFETIHRQQDNPTSDSFILISLDHNQLDQVKQFIESFA